MEAAQLQTQAVLFAGRQAIKPPMAKTDPKIEKAAQDFEAVFINEFLGAMFEGIPTDGPFGGGPGEGIFRSMMLDHYSKALAAQGGFGLSDAIKHQLLAEQERAR